MVAPSEWLLPLDAEAFRSAKRKGNATFLTEPSSSEHLEFDLVPRPLQVLISSGPLPGHAGLEPVGPVADPVHGDRPEQLLVQRRQVPRAAVGPAGDQR